jgi:hypothetical protein
LVEIGVLTLWLGASVFFAGAVAPAAFAVLSTPSLAGALVGRLLPPLFLSGVAIALAILAIEASWPRAGRRIRVVAASTMLAACAIAEFIVGQQIDRLRNNAGRPLSELATEDPRRVAFGRLHALSVAALAVAMLAAAAVIAAASRASTSARV